MQSSLGAGADPPSGAVELREDVPLKARGAAWGAGGAGCAGGCGGGPRLVVACFAALTAAITLALFTQIYYGDYEVVPHGSVSSSAAACSRAGTDALKAGGRALDAAAAAALCLAVTAPHLTSLDASGSLLYWEYRQVRTQKPTLVEWGGPPQGDEAEAGAGAGAEAEATERPPRLVAALAALHAEFGALPWARLLQPAIRLAKDGFQVSASLAGALAGEAAGGAPPAGSFSTAPKLAQYLESLQLNTSAELAARWAAGAGLRRAPAPRWEAGAARLYAGGGAATARALGAFALATHPAPKDTDEASKRVASALEQLPPEGAGGAGGGVGVGGGVATGLAVIDRLDTYVALVTGLSRPFGSGPAGALWTRDVPRAALDLAPAIMVGPSVCGTRSVLGGESAAALAAVAAALGDGDGAAAVERARPPPARGAPVPAVNLVQQRADALLSHADSRGGGLSSRF